MKKLSQNDEVTCSGSHLQDRVEQGLSFQPLLLSHLPPPTQGFRIPQESFVQMLSKNLVQSAWLCLPQGAVKRVFH